MPVAMTAQELTLTCSGDIDASCTGWVAPADSMQQARFLIHVRRTGDTAVSRTRVSFRATSGFVQADSSYTDAAGYVRAVWFRFKGADAAGIGVEASDGSRTGVRFIELKPRKVATPTTIVLTPRDGFTQSWFEKSQLPEAVLVELRDSTATGLTKPIIDPAVCGANKVRFVRVGAPATVSPDTAPARLDPQRGGCYAQTFWSLGEGIGERVLEVHLVPGTGIKSGEHLEAYAWTRATAKFVAGFATGKLKAYLGLDPASTRTVRIELVDASGVTRSYDTTETTGTPAPKHVPAERVYSAVAGISVPIPLAFLADYDGLSLTAGADLAHPRDRVFLGLSVLRLFGFLNPVIEVVPVDVHALGFWARQPELVDPLCAPAACRTQKKSRYQGIAWMLTADATSLIGELVKKLAP